MFVDLMAGAGRFCFSSGEWAGHGVQSWGVLGGGEGRGASRGPETPGAAGQHGGPFQRVTRNVEWH